MGKRKRHSEPELPLFDLPLHPDGEAPDAAFEEGEEHDASEQVSELPDAEELPAAAAEPDQQQPARWQDRWLSGLVDLAAQLAAAALAVLATYLLEAPAELGDWPAFAVLALVFSFLYWVVPLAFWGQTPGMAWIGHVARSLSDEPLTFGQTFLRWLGALITLALAGLPILLALGGRSLTDRLSDSKTVTV